mmetsp:Transcript_7160/g.15369  ORF Transcript_7160/g.15369 Transcript_7160/m.15369 type:complete len:348 (-) Transcript_7160:1180-2223(-)
MLDGARSRHNASSPYAESSWGGPSSSRAGADASDPIWAKIDPEFTAKAGGGGGGGGGTAVNLQRLPPAGCGGHRGASGTCSEQRALASGSERRRATNANPHSGDGLISMLNLAHRKRWDQCRGLRPGGGGRVPHRPPRLGVPVALLPHIHHALQQRRGRPGWHGHRGGSGRRGRLLLHRVQLRLRGIGPLGVRVGVPAVVAVGHGGPRSPQQQPRPIPSDNKATLVRDHQRALGRPALLRLALCVLFELTIQDQARGVLSRQQHGTESGPGEMHLNEHVPLPRHLSEVGIDLSQGRILLPVLHHLGLSSLQQLTDSRQRHRNQTLPLLSLLLRRLNLSGLRGLSGLS